MEHSTSTTPSQVEAQAQGPNRTPSLLDAKARSKMVAEIADSVKSDYMKVKLDPEEWVTWAEACTIMKVVKRSLDENMKSGRWKIEKKYLRRHGKAPTPIYYVPDLRAAKNLEIATRTPAVVPDIAMRDQSLEIAAGAMTLIQQAVETLAEIARTPPPNRGRFLTLEEASRRKNLPNAQQLLARVAKELWAKQSPDVWIGDRIMIREAAVDEIDALDLRGADAQRLMEREARLAKRAKQAEEAAAAKARATPKLAAGGREAVRR